MAANSTPPKVFISYAWEDDIKAWVLDFATRLRSDGVNAILDQWETVPGDQLTEFMEKSVRESDFVVFVCTPTYKRKSDRRKGGVGYEGSIITGEVFAKNNHRKFIPVLRKGKWMSAAPSWATSKLFIDLRNDPYNEMYYQQLLNTLFRKSPTAPPVWDDTLREKAKREATEKVAREKAEKEAAEKARLEAEEFAKQKAAKEKAERELAEKDAREKIEREAAENPLRKEEERDKAEKEAREKLELESAERARKEKTERELAEKAAQEKARHEAAEKAKREKAERQNAQIGELKEVFSNSFTSFKLAVSKTKPLLRIVGIIGIILVLLWGGSWAVPQVLALFPTPSASITPRPTNTLAPSSSPVPFTRTPEPSQTPTRVTSTTPTTLPTEVSDTKGVSMMLVPAGEFIMGSDDVKLDAITFDEQPIHMVSLDSYYIDKFEVTNSRYSVCVNAGICLEPIDKTFYIDPARKDHPVVNVNWQMARDYCNWRGARLPTEAEWEKAARGLDGRTFPWGEKSSCQNGNFLYGAKPCVGDTTTVGTYIDGVSPYGVFDMAGNVWEWTSSLGLSYPYNAADGRESVDNNGRRVLRGGSRNYDSSYATTTTRYARDPLDARSLVGFRCARDVNP